MVKMYLIYFKTKNLLLSCNEMNASYLFQQDKHYDVNYDTGDKTIQCGRHVDVFKVWLMWRAKGDIGFENQIDRLFYLAKFLYDQVKRRENFEIVLEEVCTMMCLLNVSSFLIEIFFKPEYTNVCFWYVPKSIQHLNRNSDEFKTKLNNVFCFLYVDSKRTYMLFKISILIVTKSIYGLLANLNTK
jgi:glutamate decarboxylase